MSATWTARAALRARLEERPWFRKAVANAVDLLIEDGVDLAAQRESWRDDLRSLPDEPTELYPELCPVGALVEAVTTAVYREALRQSADDAAGDQADVAGAA